MAEENGNTIKNLHLRAKLPGYFRIAAVTLLVATIGVIIFSLLKGRNPEFRMKGFPTALSNDVVAVINGYERRENEGNSTTYFIKADKATTFADNHQELENVYLQVFNTENEKFDQITAAKAVYIPEPEKKFTAFFSGNVDITTRDDLNIKTDQLSYKRVDETATAEEQVEFSRQNIKGRSFGALVKVKEKVVELLRDVEIETEETSERGKTTMTAGYAEYNQATEQVQLRESITAKLSDKKDKRTIDVSAKQANVFLIAKDGQDRDVDRLELVNEVKIDSVESGGKPTRITAGYALYQKPIDRFELRDSVHIVTVEDEKPTDIRGAAAIYDQRNGMVFVSGGAEIQQGNDKINGENITAELNRERKLKKATVTDKAKLVQILPERTIHISAAQLTALFNERQEISLASAVGQTVAVLIPANASEYSKVTMSAPQAIDVFFKGTGLVERMQTKGRTTIQLNVPANGADAANKRLTADSVQTVFGGNGDSIQKAQGVGNAELVVEPLVASAQNYITTVTAPRFECEFFPTGNNAKICTASDKTRTVRVPTVADKTRGTQTIVAKKLTAVFSENSNDVETLTASGDAKFTELDRNAIAEQITFDAPTRIVKLRGGEPTIWDSNARAKATVVDWETANGKSTLSGNVSTTYYSGKRADDATPFGQGSKPVFITSEKADFDHRNEVAVYSGNARAWQENNFVRGNRLTLTQKTGEFQADGNVQSTLYDAKRTENGKETQIPVYASADQMTYNRDNRRLRYETNVDIRQGTDRLTGGIATVYLSEKNEVSRTDIENDVVITQPNRRAYSDSAQYDVAEQNVILRGNPARVVDSVSGSAEGGTLTMNLRENRVENLGKSSKENSGGRTRTVYKVQ